MLRKPRQKVRYRFTLVLDEKLSANFDNFLDLIEEKGPETLHITPT